MRRRIGWTLALVWAAHAAAADWPQFQGPGQSGVSPETGLLRAWPAEGPKVLWTLKLGVGYGGAAVRDGKVYVLDRVDDRQDVLRCLDLATGKEEWTSAYDAPGTRDYNGSRTTPTVDEKHVYTMGPFGDFHCVDRATHQVVWAKNIIRDFPDHDAPSFRIGPNVVPKWGVSQHPVLYKNLVIVTPQSHTVGVVAYDRDSGELRWKSPHVGMLFFSHATPLVTTLCGVDQVVVLGNKHLSTKPPAIVSGVDANTGQLLWTTETPRSYNIPISMPVKISDDRLFIAGGYKYGASILKVAKNEPSWTTEFVLKDNDNCTPHLHNVLLYKGYLYAQSYDKFHNPVVDGVMQNNGLECLDLQGEVKWKTGPKLLFDSGNILIADGLLYVMHGSTGVLTLAEATPDGYKELAKAKVLEARLALVWAPMALADGKLLVRDQHEMKCLDVRGK